MKEKQKRLLACTAKIYQITVLVGGFGCQRNVRTGSGSDRAHCRGRCRAAPSGAQRHSAPEV